MLVALFSLSSWCLVMVVWLFLAVQWVCLRFVIVVFPDHTHILFFFIIFIIAYDLKLFRKCENLFVIPSRDKILHDIFW